MTVTYIDVIRESPCFSAETWGLAALATATAACLSPQAHLEQFMYQIAPFVGDVGYQHHSHSWFFFPCFFHD